MEKPILFNAEMINAILDGRKTMTRRIIRPQPVNPKWSGSEWIDTGCDDTKHFTLKCYYKKGMNLWVREPWCVHQLYDAIPPRMLPEAEYLQNGVTYLANVYNDEKSLWMGRTRPSIFMPRKLSRISLEITNVRVERIQDISEDDALAEGVKNVLQFSNLWDSLNKVRGYGWNINSWVWKISFRRIAK